MRLVSHPLRAAVAGLLAAATALCLVHGFPIAEEARYDPEAAATRLKVAAIRGDGSVGAVRTAYGPLFGWQVSTYLALRLTPPGRQLDRAVVEYAEASSAIFKKLSALGRPARADYERETRAVNEIRRTWPVVQTIAVVFDAIAFVVLWGAAWAVLAIAGRRAGPS
jgi:hypothetical protein